MGAKRPGESMTGWSGDYLSSYLPTEYLVIEGRCGRPVNVLDGCCVCRSVGFIGIRVMRELVLDFSGPELGTEERFWQAADLCVCAFLCVCVSFAELQFPQSVQRLPSPR